MIRICLSFLFSPWAGFGNPCCGEYWSLREMARERLERRDSTSDVKQCPSCENVPSSSYSYDTISFTFVDELLPSRQSERRVTTLKLLYAFEMHSQWREESRLSFSVRHLLTNKEDYLTSARSAPTINSPWIVLSLLKSLVFTALYRPIFIFVLLKVGAVQHSFTNFSRSPPPLSPRFSRAWKNFENTFFLPTSLTVTDEWSK